MKKYIRLGIGLIVTAFFLYMSYKRVGDLELSKLFSYPINYMLVFLSIFCFILAQWFRALSWSKGMNSKFKSFRVFKAVCIGNGTNMVLPFRLGEVARIAVLANGKKSVYAEIGICVLLERLLDIVILIFLAVMAVFFIDFDLNILNKIIFLRNLVIAGVLGVILLFGIFLWMKSRGLRGFLWLRNNASISKFIEKLFKIKVFQSPKGLVKGLAFLTVSWLCVYACTIFGILSVGISIERAVPSALTVLIMTNLAMLIPSAPGGIGVFQYASIYSLNILGINGLDAAVLSVLLHLVQYIALLPLTLYFFLLNKISNRDKVFEVIGSNPKKAVGKGTREKDKPDGGEEAGDLV